MGYASTCLYDKPSVLIGRKGTIGKVKYVDHPFWTVDTLFYTEVNEDLVLPKFLYYMMSQYDFNQYDEGTTIPSLRTETLNRLEYLVPSLSTQRKIAAVLSSLDDKIETNHAICRNLEEQADAFYKQYFVSGEKSSWNEGKLSDFIEVKYGKDHKKLADGTIPVYGSGGLMRYAERALYESESVLIPRKGTLNNVMLVMEPFWSVDTMFYSVMKVKNAAKFVFLFLKGKDLASMNAGSAVPSMTTEILNSMELRLPPKAVLDDFEHNVAPIYQTIATKKCENERLASLRDTLLPRLMSGELDVRDVHLR